MKKGRIHINPKAVLCIFIILLLHSCDKENEEIFNGLFLAGDLPHLNDPVVKDIDVSTARLEGSFSSTGNCFISTAGVCWSTDTLPTLEDYHTSDKIINDSFTSTLTGLHLNTTYFVRTYAINKVGTAYSYGIKISTNGYPVVVKPRILNVNSNSVSLEAVVSYNGGFDVTRRGICWGSSPDPDLTGNIIESGTGEGSFHMKIEGLERNNKYYVRSFATNKVGTIFSDNLLFEAVGVPVVMTGGITAVFSGSAVAAGTVLSDEGAEVISRGTCCSTDTLPGYIPNNIYSSKFCTSDGNGSGNYSSILSSLKPGTVYYIRAYAINKAGIGFGEIVSFRTAGVPVVKTLGVSDVSNDGARISGSLISGGGSPVTEYGVCWNTAGNPTVDESAVQAECVSGSFSGNLNQLWPSTIYFARAYARNSYGIGYGAVVSFTTPIGLPAVKTNAFSTFKASSAVGGGLILSTGGTSISAYGLCWSTTPGPDINDLYTIHQDDKKDFIDSVFNLSVKTRYFVRAYATNSSGTSYGEEITFQTWGNTGSVTDIDGNSYKTIEIGSQVWMQENLIVSHFRNGDQILQLSTESLPGYINRDNWGDILCYYNYYAAIDPRGLCPVGWHIPSEKEFKDLIIYVGSEKSAIKLKASTGWDAIYIGTNESGFTSLGTGYYSQPGWPTGYYNSEYYWSSAESGITLNLNYDWPTDLDGVLKSKALSVRCIKDE